MSKPLEKFVRQSIKILKVIIFLIGAMLTVFLLKPNHASYAYDYAVYNIEVTTSEIKMLIESNDNLYDYGGFDYEMDGDCLFITVYSAPYFTYLIPFSVYPETKEVTIAGDFSDLAGIYLINLNGTTKTIWEKEN